MEALNYIKQRVLAKLKGWKRDILTAAEREVLIKAVAASIPAYPMTVFKFPRRTCKEINAVIAKFWWGQTNEEGKIHWQKWEELTKSKLQGGMGLRDIDRFNQALLAKQVWRYMERPEALWARIIKGIYFPKKEMMEARKGCHPSWFWSSFLHGRELISSNVAWKLGDGAKICIWNDKWILDWRV